MSRFVVPVCVLAALLLPDLAQATRSQKLDDMLSEDLGMVADEGVYSLDDDSPDDDDLLDDSLLSEDELLILDEDVDFDDAPAAAPTSLPSFSDLDEGDDRFEFDGPTTLAEPTPSRTAPSGLGLDLTGKEPLADNFSVTVLAYATDVVVVELPVLVARSGVGHESDDFTLVGEVFCGTSKVSEVRQHINAAAIADLGPTIAWLKVSAPVDANEGEISFVVTRHDTGSDEPTALFTRTTAYALR